MAEEGLCEREVEDEEGTGEGRRREKPFLSIALPSLSGAFKKQVATHPPPIPFTFTAHGRDGRDAKGRTAIRQEWGRKVDEGPLRDGEDLGKGSAATHISSTSLERAGFSRVDVPAAGFRAAASAAGEQS